MDPVAGAEVNGLFEVFVEGVGHGALYLFVLGDRELPDPYARFCPLGVHGPSMVVEPRHAWQCEPVPRLLSELVIYELHVGTFTPAGTYEAAMERLAHVVALGATAIELMPVSSAAGTRGWGYDGVAHFAPFAPYGTPDELRELVDAAHEVGLSVLLDVVYNHFGPSGNYLSAYCPDYFRRDVRNAWGDAPNFEHPMMRRLVLDNARYWLEDFRFDGLRLDATHAIVDPSSRHVLRELVEEVATLVPRRLLVAEDDRNDPSLVTRTGMDALWTDDFHHQVHVTVTGERDGYYAAHEPGPTGIARAIERGWTYEGQAYPPGGAPRGAPADELEACRFVYCIQNHDQVGNRALGERLSALVSLDAYCAVSTLLLMLPMTPLLFMGQEWAATSPFLYFTDHDEELGRLVSAGRREEFGTFAAFAEPDARTKIPDPQALSTFERSRLDWEEATRGPHARVLALYQKLLRLRRADPVLRAAGRDALSAEAQGGVLVVQRWSGAEARFVVVNLGGRPVELASLGLRATKPRLLLASDGAAAASVAAPRTALVLAGTRA